MLRQALFAAIITIALPIAGSAAKLSGNQIRELLIKQSIATYPGNCPCPYNTDARGRSCGKRSAYSKQGGYAPLCFPSDITNEMIAEYREKM